MRVVDAIVEILKREGVEFLVCFPTTPLMEAAASAGMRSLVCRQERVGVGIADGFTRVSDGRRIGVFTMQFGPGAENSFSGIATAYSDSVPVLLMPLGHARARIGVFPHFSSVRSFSSVTKHAEEMRLSSQVSDVMRRAFSQLKIGRPGPVLVEIPADLAMEETSLTSYEPVRPSISLANPEDITVAAKVLLDAQKPMIIAGQGIFYARASKELREFAELLHIPVMTTLAGKSSFPEDHSLSLGAGCRWATTEPVVHYLRESDVILAIGSSLTRHGGGMTIPIPDGKKIIHVTNDPRDINKDYRADYPLLGDARLVIQQLIAAVKTRAYEKNDDNRTEDNIKRLRQHWLNEWMPKLNSKEVPINPYRVIWEFMNVVNPNDAIVTHDAGSPRDQLVPFYKATIPHSYIGWGKSHALGAGLGLIMGAKLAAPDKFCVNFMGDAAFGMTGLDFETAVRCGIPITTIVLKNSVMASEKDALPISHERFGTRELGGNYAEVGRALGGFAQRIEDPEGIVPALASAKKANEEGRAALVEFITSEETSFSHVKPF